MSERPETTDEVIAATRTWLERAVIGLKLCPFAAEQYIQHRVRFSVSTQRSTAGLRADLSRELQALEKADPRQCETTLLIHPWVLEDFGDYNQFLDDSDDLIEELDLLGELQVASFHPTYQFAGTAAEDIENYSNRSPYPMLHLLRESSITRAVESFEHIDEIGPRNIDTLRRLGHEGWRALWLDR